MWATFGFITDSCPSLTTCVIFGEFGFNSAIYGGDITQPEFFRDTSAGLDAGFGTIGMPSVYGSQIYIPPTNTVANREASDFQSLGE